MCVSIVCYYCHLKEIFIFITFLSSLVRMNQFQIFKCRRQKLFVTQNIYLQNDNKLSESNVPPSEVQFTSERSGVFQNIRFYMVCFVNVIDLTRYHRFIHKCIMCSLFLRSSRNATSFFCPEEIQNQTFSSNGTTLETKQN